MRSPLYGVGIQPESLFQGLEAGGVRVNIRAEFECGKIVNRKILVAFTAMQQEEHSHQVESGKEPQERNQRERQRAPKGSAAGAGLRADTTLRSRSLLAVTVIRRRDLFSVGRGRGSFAYSPVAGFFS